MCLDLLITRRDFLGAMLGATVCAPQAWAIRAMAAADAETIMLPNTADEYTPRFFERAFDAIGTVAKRVGSSLRFAFIDAAGKARLLSLSFENGGSRKHASPVLRSEDGSELSIAHTGYGPLNHLEFSTSHKDFFKSLREQSRRAWTILKDSIRNQDALTLGIKAVAIGIGVWIGIHVAGFLLAALGVFVYYALIVALIIAGAMAINALFQKRFSTDERTAHAKERFMQKTARFSDLVDTIAG